MEYGLSMLSRAKLDELRALVRASGLRATPSRLAVLDMLLGSAQPLSHADVSARLSGRGWDPATLYRNLMDFVEVNLARRSDMGDHVWRFEPVRSEPHASMHPHFVCTECGTVACLPEMQFVVPRASAPKSVKEREIEVQVRGLCDGCA